LWWGGLVTSWFWVVGAIVLSLLPPLVKSVIGGDDTVITAFLAVFAVAIGVGSALASWLAHGRIVLFPTLLAAVLLGLFALDLAWATWDATPPATVGLAGVFSSAHGLRITADLAGLAIAGGLFIVPVFSAVQAWAGADRRARIVAAVNVLNAAFMTVAGIGVAVLQKAGITLSMLFLAIGSANFAVAIAIAATMPKHTRERASAYNTRS
jgi:acyl-[acyl-carrier-protein]-phospholipid O-acyltransferase/long-chain-fatty-acid--[acyl-carrier-protein] ligase